MIVGDDKVTFSLITALKSLILEEACYRIDVIDELAYDRMPHSLSRDTLEDVLVLDSV